jgi:hypothetical protein
MVRLYVVKGSVVSMKIEITSCEFSTRSRWSRCIFGKKRWGAEELGLVTNPHCSW